MKLLHLIWRDNSLAFLEPEVATKLIELLKEVGKIK